MKDKNHIHNFSQTIKIDVIDAEDNPMSVLARQCNYYYTSTHEQCQEFTAFEYLPRKEAEKRLEEVEL